MLHNWNDTSSPQDIFRTESLYIRIKAEGRGFDRFLFCIFFKAKTLYSGILKWGASILLFSNYRHSIFMTAFHRLECNPGWEKMIIELHTFITKSGTCGSDSQHGFGYHGGERIRSCNCSWHPHTVLGEERYHGQVPIRAFPKLGKAWTGSWNNSFIPYSLPWWCSG